MSVNISNRIPLSNSTNSASLNWETIGHALRSLFYKYDVDLSGVGKTQRLEYQDFEKIFYHLIAIFDPAECRRKFWTLYPSRNNEEKSKFINETVQFINSKQLSSTRVSASQLRMCGGEPFRRLLTDLIVKAAEFEIATIIKKTPECLVNHTNMDCDEFLNTYGQVGEKVIEKLNLLRETEDKLNLIHEQIDDMDREIDNKWESQVGEVFAQDYFVDQNSFDRIKDIHKTLVSRLEKSYERCKAASKEIKDIPKPPETVNLGTPPGKMDVSKRVSELFKEMRQRLTLSPDFTPETSKSKLINKITHRLIYYDNGVDTLISTLEAEREKADEELLKQPELQERCNFFKSLIPFVDCKPISFGRSKLENPKLSDIRKILDEYSNPKYDDDEIFSYLERNFSQWK